MPTGPFPTLSVAEPQAAPTQADSSVVGAVSVQLAGATHILPLPPVGQGPLLSGPQLPCPEQQDPPQSRSAAQLQGESSAPAAVAASLPW